MTDTASSMRARIPAQSVIEELVRRKHASRRPSGLARFFGRSPLPPESVNWYLGAKGEIAVGSVLAQLPPEWATFHALPVGTKASDIDHLVVGPGGIFTINTKNHRGKRIWVARRAMLVDGQKVPHINHAEFEAERVTKLLRERMPLLPPVQPVVAVVEPRQITIKEKPEKVKVIDARNLPRWLSGLTVVLAEPELDEVVDILDHPGTWRPFRPTDIQLSPDELLQQFTELDLRVKRAKVLRVCWALVGWTSVTFGTAALSPLLMELVMASTQP